MKCSKDPLGGCPECSHVQEGSCFDGTHLYCELFGVWTSLMGGEWRGYCLDPERDGRWHNLCFSDLTPDERERVTDGRDAVWLLSLACILADALHDMGDALGVVRGGDAE